MVRHSKNPLAKSKITDYYGNVRGDIVTVVRNAGIKARNVIEIGCGAATTAPSMRQTVGATRYVGVELMAKAAEKARVNLDEVHVADVEKVLPSSLGLHENEFDLLLAIDVLEHLIDPWDSLARWVKLLRPGGYAVVSVPNVQNISLISNLLQGNWEYASEGLLDATHLRFFTLDSLATLVTGAGLSINTLNAVPGPIIDMTQVKETGNSVNIDKLHINGLTRKQMASLFTFQYIMTAQRPSGQMVA